MMFYWLISILSSVGLVFLFMLCFDVFQTKIKPKLKKMSKKVQLNKISSMYKKRSFLDANFKGKYSAFDLFVFPIYDYDSHLYAMVISLSKHNGVQINVPYNDIVYMYRKKANDEYIKEINDRIKKLIDFYENNRK